MNPFVRKFRFSKWKGFEQQLNQMVDQAVSMRFTGGPGIRVSQNSTGVGVEALAEETRSSPKVQFRGEYDQRLPYNTLDITRVTFGIEAGTYLALKPVPANAAGTATYFPWSGNGYWVLIGRISDQSSWA